MIQPYIHKKTSVLAIEHPYESIALRVLVGAIIFCIAMYLYFVTASVLNVIARKEARAYAALLETQVGQLQEEYFALASSVTPEYSATLGLTSIEAPRFVYRLGNISEVPQTSKALASATI
jgi:hypothetical protein